MLITYIKSVYLYDRYSSFNWCLMFHFSLLHTHFSHKWWGSSNHFLPLADLLIVFNSFLIFLPVILFFQSGFLCCSSTAHNCLWEIIAKHPPHLSFVWKDASEPSAWSLWAEKTRDTDRAWKRPLQLPFSELESECLIIRSSLLGSHMNFSHHGRWWVARVKVSQNTYQWYDMWLTKVIYMLSWLISAGSSSLLERYSFYHP